MEDALSLLASSALDMVPKYERNRILNEALEYVQDDGVDVLAHWKGTLESILLMMMTCAKSCVLKTCPS
jgi:hypothetical protein